MSSAVASPALQNGQGEARSQWFTHLVDLSTGGTLGLAQGRTAEAGKGPLDSHAKKLRDPATDSSAPTGPPPPPGLFSSPTRSTWSSSPTAR